MTNLNLPAAIFWDMDGTLIDSEPLWEQATYGLSERLGRPLDAETRAKTMGATFPNTFRIVTEWTGADADYDTERRWMYDRVAELMRGRLAPNPGVTDLLAQLRDLGLPMLVTTNTERELADPSIAAVGHEYFTDSIAGDEVSVGKPDPEMYLEAARRVGHSPSECLVFEDSVAGMTAGVAAGCKVIAITADPVPGAVSMLEFQEKLSFEGVSAHTLSQWWTTLVAREEL